MDHPSIPEADWNHYSLLTNESMQSLTSSSTTNVEEDYQDFSKIIWSENNFNRFYDKIVTTAEEHNIDLPELSPYVRLQVEMGVSQMYLHLQKHTSQ